MHAAERHAEHAQEYHYERHSPEETVLYRVVSTYWSAFRERLEGVGSLPKFVVRDVDEYLRCGILEHGFIRAKCTDCGFEQLVALSGKRRGFCPSCLGRRMSDTAVWLTEHVIPRVQSVHVAVGIACSSGLRPHIVCDGIGYIHSGIAAELSMASEA